MVDRGRRTADDTAHPGTVAHRPGAHPQPVLTPVAGDLSTVRSRFPAGEFDVAVDAAAAG